MDFYIVFFIIPRNESMNVKKNQKRKRAEKKKKDEEKKKKKKLKMVLKSSRKEEIADMENKEGSQQVRTIITTTIKTITSNQR